MALIITYQVEQLTILKGFFKKKKKTILKGFFFLDLNNKIPSPSISSSKKKKKKKILLFQRFYEFIYLFVFTIFCQIKSLCGF